MRRASRSGWDKKRLRRWLVLFFIAVAIPTGILVRQAYSQLKWEAFHRHRVMAEELANRIDRRFLELINTEEARSFTDYAFLIVAGDPSAKFVQRSPLSAYPVAAAIPGLIGYFQVDAQGDFSSPLLPQPGVQPSAYGVSNRELDQRRALQNHIQQILIENRLVHARGADALGSAVSLSGAQLRREEDKASEPLESLGIDADKELKTKLELSKQQQPGASQAAFDRLDESRMLPDTKNKQAPLTLGRVEDLKLDAPYQIDSRDKVSGLEASDTAAPSVKRGVRKERSALPEKQLKALNEAVTAEAGTESEIGISLFESEIDAYALSLLDSGHFALFRKVWRDGQRYIQGALIEPQGLFRGVIESTFRGSVLSRVSDVAVAYRGDVLSGYGAQTSREYFSSTEELLGTLLYQTRLSTPLNDLTLIFSITQLPAGPGAAVLTWVTAILLLVLCGGFYLTYRLGTEQINLNRQQQDFVSAVSHELKTPLTSIRMYGEMLREGWADEEKKKTYYEYIHEESERLSRLIDNVLQLARMTRNDMQIELKSIRVAKLMDNIRSKVSSQIERMGFGLNITCPEEARKALIQVDVDCFIQILINLVDNAIKFSRKAEKRVIDIGCQLQGDRTVLLSVRDYGPGVPKEQLRKIFKLFYRSENEMTRETVGTGIGLALVYQLTLAMHGQVDVVNREPGAEFRVSFPRD